MKISHLRANHLNNPIGYTLEPVSLSWIVEETDAKKQAGAQIVIMTHAPNGSETLVYDSGRRADISSLGFCSPLELKPYTKYLWRVTVWGDNGEQATSDGASFETAKMNDAWTGKWIATSFGVDTHPYLRKQFSIDGEVLAARAYACGLGLYELEINGQKAGDEYLLPGYHAYDCFQQYQTFDVTHLIHAGENAIGAILGDGWYKGRFVFEGGFANLYGSRMQFICELKVWLKDGKTFTIATDESWLCHASPILESSIYDGEVYDSTAQIANWSCIDCDTSSWQPVEIVAQETDKLTARCNPPIVIKERLKPVELIYTPNDESVLDFGQNMTGWVEFTVHEPKGTRVRLSFGEIMQHGVFYRDNLRTAKAVYEYISDGTETVARPHFTFYGFRFVKVEGIANIRLEDFTACVIMSDLEQTGNIETANPLVNKLFQNALWGQKGNFLDIPTDCPQRDERMGWTGDAAIFAGTASQNMYAPAFFHHYLANLVCEQRLIDGSVPLFVPTPKPPADQRHHFFFREYHGYSVWGDVATIIPWTLYEIYGDKSLLAQHYPMMKAWVNYITREVEKSGEVGVWKTGRHLGDWLALDTDDPQAYSGATDVFFIASAFYYYSTTLLAKAAKALRYEDDAERYNALAAQIKQVFLREYFDEQGNLMTKETQTAYLVSLFMGLHPEGCQDALTQKLKERIAANAMHLNTGFVGTPFLCRVLSANHANDYAYTLLLNDDFPSWLYAVKMGATTVWERWNSVLPDGSISGTGMNSLNHYAYGSIVDWMYRNLCGLNPVDAAPGYKKAIIQPQPDTRIAWAKADMLTASGKYHVSWRYDETGKINYDITVPFIRYFLPLIFLHYRKI